jgi:AmiR/NasT family two-component response regulator
MKRSLRIVVADDEPDMRDFFQRILPLLGHQVVATAATGRELIQHCRSLRPNLVIADIKMPDKDGIEAAVEIGRDEPIPVILVSAYHDAELIDRAGVHHVMAYLVKPIEQADLEPAIVLAMRRFDEFRSLRQEAADLRQALEDRKSIEQAKGILMKRSGLTEPEAFRRLQKLASEQQRKLVEIAQVILLAEKAFQPADKT